MWLTASGINGVARLRHPLEGQQKEPITVEIYSAGRRCTQVLHSGVDFNGFTEVWHQIMHYLINGLYFSVRPQSAMDSHSTALLLFWCALVCTVAYCYIVPITILIVFIYLYSQCVSPSIFFILRYVNHCNGEKNHISKLAWFYFIVLLILPLHQYIDRSDNIKYHAVVTQYRSVTLSSCNWHSSSKNIVCMLF